MFSEYYKEAIRLKNQGVELEKPPRFTGTIEHEKPRNYQLGGEKISKIREEMRKQAC